MVLTLLAVLFFGYLLGSLPFAYLAVRLIKNSDIRDQGSGNVGATNTLRVLGPMAGILVLFLDGMKGWLAVVLSGYLGATLPGNQFPWILVAGGLTAMFGHVFPVWLGFKGGKGVATGAGVLLALSWEIFLLAVGIAVLIIILTRYVSLGSLAGAGLVFIFMVILKKPLPFQIVSFLAGIFIFVKHKANIQRLLSGQEKKLGQKEK